MIDFDMILTTIAQAKIRPHGRCWGVSLSSSWTQSIAETGQLYGFSVAGYFRSRTTCFSILFFGAKNWTMLEM